MKRTFASSLLLITILLMGCNSNKEVLDNRPAVVMGKVYGESSYVNISFHNFLHERFSLTQGVDQEDKTFEFILHPYHAQDAGFTYQNTTKKIFISPNDTLYIVARVDSLNNLHLEFEGNYSRINNEMQLYVDNAKQDIKAGITDIHSTSARSYLSELEKAIEKQNQILDGFINAQHPSEEFIDWARNDIRYSTANYLIDYKMNLVINNLQRNDSLFQSDLFSIYNEEGLASSMYGVHLWHHVTDQYIHQHPRILDLFEKEDYYNGYDATIQGILDNEPKGIIRDIMVFRMITATLSESPDDLEKIRNKYASVIENEMLRTELSSLSKEMETESSIAYNEKDSKNISEDMYSYLLEESKKQLLYVDIWATWCGPCRAEIPKLKSLHENIKNEDIKIISICCDTKKNDWLAVIEDNDLPGDHFLLNKSETELLRSKITGFQGFPTYLIIKDGKIIDANAQRPSSGNKIVDKLKSYL